MDKTLVALIDSPLETKRGREGLRFIKRLTRREGQRFRVFFIGDAVTCALKEPPGAGDCEKLQRVLRAVIGQASDVGMFDAGLEAVGLAEARLLDGCRR